MGWPEAQRELASGMTGSGLAPGRCQQGRPGVSLYRRELDGLQPVPPLSFVVASGLVRTAPAGAAAVESWFRESAA